MSSFLGKITKNLIIAIPVMMVAGFIFGMIVDSGFLKNLIIPFTFLMVYPMMVNLNIKKVFEGGDLKAQVLTQIINFGIVPFLAFGIGLLFFKDSPYMALGLLLTGLVPTSGMTISWTGFAKGNLEAAVKMTVIGLTVGSIATPFYVKFLMGATIEIDFFKVVQQIVIIVFVPMIAGFFTRQRLVKKYGLKGFKQNVGPKFPPISTLGVIGIVFIAMALKAKGIAASPQMLLYILIPLVIIYAFNFTLSSIVGKLFLSRGDAIALVYGSVMRNLSIALAIAINAFGKEGASAALVVAIAYIIQVQSAAWYVKFTDKIFGPADVEGDEIISKKTEATAKEDLKENLSPMTMDIKKILFATDFSETARHAVKYACNIGNKYNAEVHAMHVVPDLLEEYSTGTGIDLTTHVDKKKKEALNQKNIDSAKQTIRERMKMTSLQVLNDMPHCPLSEERIIVIAGNPVDEIVKTAASKGFDLIIMGTHGHGNLEEIMIGSTASGVIMKSSIPVLVAKNT
ncbi:Bile acid:sodium symporter [Desulfamplus magnetovallimortis]|uniref:Bile acid:sodium symporter n=1 Tax=Desulfamplus magnetovallimortis TaxID=1246637 RepID=A0A1W1H4Z3_9BACT|nr:universal stress protein [Desulfamplus magnetovallimortis]SLM27553.1 Bile acid:sodium symporter [Desulfamplus magnetovallimortis]